MVGIVILQIYDSPDLSLYMLFEYVGQDRDICLPEECCGIFIRLVKIVERIRNAMHEYMYLYYIRIYTKS